MAFPTVGTAGRDAAVAVAVYIRFNIDYEFEI